MTTPENHLAIETTVRTIIGIEGYGLTVAGQRPIPLGKD